MSMAAYEREMLATYAAAHINAAGTTIVTFGCSLKRITTGVVEVSFDSSAGLVADEIWLTVQTKGASNAPAYAVVEDTSETVKTIFTFRGVAPVDADLEIRVNRTFDPQAGDTTIDPLCGLDCANPVYAGSAPTEWVAAPTMPDVARYMGACATTNSDGEYRVYVIGHKQAGASLVQQFYEVQATGTVAAIDSSMTGVPATPAVAESTPITLDDCGIFLNYNNNAYYRYNACLDSWSLVGSFYVEGLVMQVATRSGDKVWITGDGLASIVYDIPSGSFTNAVTPPVGYTPDYYAVSPLPNTDEFLVCGGSNDGAVLLATAYRFNPTTQIYTPIADMGTARSNHRATALASGKVLVTGSAAGTPAALNSIDTAEVYDPNTNTWAATGNNMTSQRTRHRQVLMPNGKVLVTGGFEAGATVATVDLYDPDTNQFTAATSMLTDRAEHALVVVPDLRQYSAIVAGGYSTSLGGQTDTAELYRLASSPAGEGNLFLANTTPKGVVFTSAATVGDEQVLQYYSTRALFSTLVDWDSIPGTQVKLRFSGILEAGSTLGAVMRIRLGGNPVQNNLEVIDGAIVHDWVQSVDGAISEGMSSFVAKPVGQKLVMVTWEYGPPPGPSNYGFYGATLWIETDSQSQAMMLPSNLLIEQGGAFSGVSGWVVDFDAIPAATYDLAFAAITKTAPTATSGLIQVRLGGSRTVSSDGTVLASYDICDPGVQSPFDQWLPTGITVNGLANPTGLQFVKICANGDVGTSILQSSLLLKWTV